ncbi:uncharacterized protein STEHIDRAFT_109313 [Stereum hirsutum FP-91666 SS1]|uniref:uncharacterized protein n=1 Tax=Stereum hirsutum (strain FP-91666) TaxID=721885 RepID=UPI000441050A|nr:uncharacterized protein STEHIDRAFT_109313 [Stereum hirsutum FP-91666 SS1]EIM89024.1 hypothetical protein STEHIDRAFT_109313 [Stereum hirsutum FP-91666 SS1]
MAAAYPSSTGTFQPKPITHIRPHPRHVLPEERVGKEGLQVSTTLWMPGVVFHRTSHCIVRYEKTVQWVVYECLETHESSMVTHPSYQQVWRAISSTTARQPNTRPVTPVPEGQQQQQN